MVDGFHGDGFYLLISCICIYFLSVKGGNAGFCGGSAVQRNIRDTESEENTTVEESGGRKSRFEQINVSYSVLTLGVREHRGFV